jgi:hypothetical protein
MGERSQRQKSGNEWSEIPAETPYLALCRKRAVCKDWVVVCAVICEPISIANSRLLGNLTGNPPDFRPGDPPAGRISDF